VQAQRRAGFSRRKLFAGAGVSLASLFFAESVVAKALRFGASANIAQPELLYPPVDLSYFDTPIGWRA
jgi:hypothetical protein